MHTNATGGRIWLVGADEEASTAGGGGRCRVVSLTEEGADGSGGDFGAGHTGMSRHHLVSRRGLTARLRRHFLTPTVWLTDIRASETLRSHMPSRVMPPTPRAARRLLRSARSARSEAPRTTAPRCVARGQGHDNSPPPGRGRRRGCDTGAVGTERGGGDAVPR